LRKRPDKPEAYQETLRRAEPLIRRGAIPQISNLPLHNQLSMRTPFIFASNASFKEVYDKPVEAQIKIYCDPNFRRAFREEMKAPRVFSGKWDLVHVQSVSKSSLKPLEGKSVAEIARERGKDPLETFFDLPVEDNLDLLYLVSLFEPMPELFGDSRTLLGVSDGGAHVDQICDAGYSTDLIGTSVRDIGTLSLELAVKRMTSEPAQFFGIRDRGRLAPGLAADLVIFDFNTIRSGERPEWRYDLPNGGRRLVVTAHGIEHIIVNGQVLYMGHENTGTMPGQVLRS